MLPTCPVQKLFIHYNFLYWPSDHTLALLDRQDVGQDTNCTIQPPGSVNLFSCWPGLAQPAKGAALQLHDVAPGDKLVELLTNDSKHTGFAQCQLWLHVNFRHSRPDRPLTGASPRAGAPGPSVAALRAHWPVLALWHSRWPEARVRQLPPDLILCFPIACRPLSG